MDKRLLKFKDACGKKRTNKTCQGLDKLEKNVTAMHNRLFFYRVRFKKQ